MSVIFTADLHLNLKSQDDYRWGLFNFLRKQKADELIIGGDLTDAKDHHSSVLVNTLHAGLMRLKPAYKKIIILKGNHDYYNPDHPFFEFVGSDNIIFVKEPRVEELSIGKATFIPAGVKWQFKLNEFPFVFTHATFSGAKAENGVTLTGVDPKVLDHYNGTVYSGDIHVPQELLRGKIIYVGAPYHTRFGDMFKPRILKLTEDGDIDLHFPSPRKVTLTITHPKDLLDASIERDASKGDHVKIRCLLHRADYYKWKEYKTRIADIAGEKGWRVFGIESVPLDIEPKKSSDNTNVLLSPQDLVLDYVARNKAGKMHLVIGQELLKE